MKNYNEFNDLNFNGSLSQFDDAPAYEEDEGLGYSPDEEEAEGHYEAFFNTGRLITLSESEKELLRGGGFDEVFRDEDNSIVTETQVEVEKSLSEEEKAKEQEVYEKKKVIFIGTRDFLVDCINENLANQQRISSEKPRVRKYNKKAEMPKVTYGKPYTEKSLAEKLKGFVLVALVMACFVGYMANSTYVTSVYINGEQAESYISYCYKWILIEDLTYTLSPFVSEAFFAGFGIGLVAMAIAGVFIWTESDSKKSSRVGHEHGNAHLGKNSDFKVYKRKFME